MLDETFELFQQRKLNAGFDQVLVRDWAPYFANEPHTHDWDTEALVAHGEFWLTLNDGIHHYKAGDTFTVLRGVVHSEKYGAEGAVFWAARKN
jgi:hypothetical protein